MVKIRFAAFASMIMAALSLSALAQQSPAAVAGTIPDGKMVVLNTNAFPTMIGELKQKYDQVENQFKPQSQKVDQLRQQVAQKENEIATKGPTLAPDKLRDLQAEVEELKRQGTRLVEDLQADYAKALDVTTKPVREKLYQFMQNYALQRSIIMIIDLPSVAQTGTLAYWSPSTDITQDFVTEYNKANPVPTAAAPPAAQPTARPTPGPTKPGVKQ
ncbi:MAG TPA: OmpH family outer membrane protein [Blastocatellia bacterium]|jgi:outer membrane protein|nr:OmpH family outer membrane protein [Blastocatellia bacterium]